MKDTTGAIIAKYLEQENVKYFFGVPGAHALPLYDAIYRGSSIKPILTKHEVGDAFMACGFAAFSGNLEDCCARVGTGATNLVSGVAGACMDSVPLLIITGQPGTKTLGRSIDQTALFKNIKKKSLMISDKQSGHCRAKI